MATRKRSTRHIPDRNTSRRQFAEFVGRYAPPGSKRVTGRSKSRFPASQVGDIINHELGITFGYWVHPERYRNHMGLILDSLNLRSNSRLASVCSGDGLFEIFLAKHVMPNGSIVAYVPNRSNLKAARLIAKREGVTNVKFEVFDPKKLGRLPRGHFDGAMSIAILHTIRENPSVLSHFQRILKRNGTAVITYSPPYLQEKFGTTHRTFRAQVRRHFSTEREGIALSPKAAERIYGTHELELRKKRGYGISQRYLVLKPLTRAS